MPDLVLNAIHPSPGRATILVVDDTEANRYAIVRHLQNADYTVLESATGIDGLTRAFTHLPDLVILDVRLPDISGFEIARRLRSDEQTAAIPLLHISASFTDTQTQVQGLDNGADGYLTHPVEPAVLLATVRSLLRAREAERRAHATARAWRATFDTIGEGVCVTDRQGLIVRCNQAFADMIGQPYATLLQRPLSAVLPEARLLAEAPFIAFESENLDGGEPLQIQGRWLRASAVALSDDHGIPTGAVCVLTDVTRQRQADERVRQVQQLEATGRLAGGVAHEINNMMTIILGYSTFVLERVDQGDRAHADLEEIHRAASRAAEVARQLLTFSRRQPVRPTALDLSAVLRDLQRTMSQLLGADRALRLDLPSSGIWARVDRGQFEQVLVNLTLNARDAMSTGGVLTMRVKAVHLDAEFAAARPGVAVRIGPYVRIDVEDTGHGMDEATRNRAFEPFFTTKEIGAGTGLGLATVYGIVKQANGYVWIDSAPGRGTIFSIYLPRIEEEAAADDDQGAPDVSQENLWSRDGARRRR